MNPGAVYKKGTCVFTVWAPFKKKVELKIIAPVSSAHAMQKGSDGCWTARLDGIKQGTRYMYIADNGETRPDPVSFFQPDGVHGASCVVDHASFKWTDKRWKGINPADMIMYEMHTGTFTKDGTFEAAAKKTGYLKKLGVNALEIMPVAQFPGSRNWGYDGAYIYSPQNTYGGPGGLKKLVNACHKAGIAVILDVVYNHLGPEGNYTGVYGPYFTHRYKTPWGDAVDFDGENSRLVREFYINNALYWLREFHIDALRLDAVHAIFDNSQKHILAEMQERVGEFSAKDGRQRYLIAESDLNESKIVRPAEDGGYGLSAQWEDDFHHCLHTALTGESQGYYADFTGAGFLERALARCYVYEGDYSPARKQAHGSPVDRLDSSRFIVFSQNHDQVGNRMLGERLISLAGFEAAKLAAGFYLLAPYVPLIFMGEEYGEDAPFLYFVSHGDPGLVEAVREGRKKEFSEFSWKGEPPDPQDENTFEQSKLKWDVEKGKHKIMAGFYRELIRIRKRYIKHRPVMERPETKNPGVIISASGGNRELAMAYNFSREEAAVLLPQGKAWKKDVDSAAKKWGGPGDIAAARPKAGEKVKILPLSFAAYLQQVEK